MRKIVLFVVLLVFASVTFAQVSKSVTLTIAGNLSTALTSEELNTITDLTVTGNIDARDFKTMRDLMPVLAEIDLSRANVAEYLGVEGTEGTENIGYFENEIPNNALKSKASLSIFKFPESVTSIGYFAFSNCSALKQITIPTKTETVKNYSFSGCSNIITINIPSSLLSIEPYAFGWTSGEIIVDTNNPNYSSLDGVLFNKDQTSLIQFPTSKLGIYNMPNTVYNIEFQAFAACKIKMINFSSNLESTGHDAFYFSDSIKTIAIPHTIKYIDKGSFSWCRNLTKVTISKGVTTIRERAFNWCFSLDSVTIPESVQTIENYAFQGCTKLSAITVFSKTPVDLINSPNVFEFIDKSVCTLFVPFGSKVAYQAADNWKDFQNIVEMEPSYEMPLQVEAGGLATLLPQSVRDTITYLALTGTIDARDFKTMRDEMPLLAEIDLSGVTIVAYTGTDGTSITGNNVYPENTIPETAFMNASYRGKTSLTNIELPNTVQFIGHQAFRSCTGLTSMTFPSSLLSISSFAFEACFNLTSVTIPASVTTIGNYAFGDSPVYFSVDENNPSYTSVDGILYNKSKTFLFQAPPSINGNFVIPSTVLTIGGYSFSRASGLLSVTIPSSVKTIMEGAFTACEGLSTIEFPTSVTSIGNVAFQSCYGLTSIIAPWPIPLSLGSGVFNNIDKTTCTLKVPQGAKAAYQAADQWKDFLNIVEMEAAELELTYVPDDNFEQALINLGYDTGPLNDSVPTANIRSIKELYISSKSINDLTGIEDFKALERLNCSGNNLQHLDVSNNLMLNYLFCSGNRLSTLDVSKNNLLGTLLCGSNQLNQLILCPGGSLKFLNCDYNLLTSINFENISLYSLYCRNNLLLNLDMSGCKELKSIACTNNYLTFLNLKNDNNTILTTMDATSNPYLNCIMVDNPDLSLEYSGWKKDELASFSVYCEFISPKMTYIPDDKFEQALIDMRYDSGPLNDSVPTMFIDKITTLIIEGRDIENLTGIEDFNSLTKLHIAYNKLSSIILTKNINLIDLRCSANPLVEFDISQCINLKKLECVSNQLTTLDISANIALQELNCADNLLTSINTLNNNELRTLNAAMNMLSTLYLPQNLRSLGCMNNQLTNIDLSAVDSLISLTLDNNKIEILDLSKNFKLRYLRCSNNLLKKLNIQNGKNQQLLWFVATNNPDLYCIEVDDPVFSITSSNWQKDPHASYSTLCNSSPVANAGPDQTVDERVLVTLYGTDSYDPDNQTLTFKWTAPEGIVLSSATIANPTFTAPDVSEDTEFIFSLKVNNGTFDSKPDSVNILIKNIYNSQTISLNSGWNIMSLNVIPQENNLKTILQPLIDSGKLKKVMNENGYVIEDWGKFGGWQNTIGDISATEGYNINVTAPATFDLEGIPVQFPFEIPLTAGWNIISWPSVMEQNSLEVFQTLIDEGKLKKVMDESGKAIENWGVFGGWQNAIGNLKPGEGYKVNVSSACTLVINEKGTKSDGIIPELVASTHFISAYKGNGTEHMNINLVNIYESGIIAGDEIGVFDGNTCVGSATISGLNRAISIPVSAAIDDKVKDGFTTGNSITLKLYRDGALYNLGFQPINNDKTVFVRNGSLFVFIDVLKSSAKNELIRNPKIHCFPNPFSDAISIEVFVPGEPGLQVTIHDSSGRKVKDLYKGSNDGKITLIWDGTNEFRQKVSPGIYSVQANKHNIKIIRK